MHELTFEEVGEVSGALTVQGTLNMIGCISAVKP